MTNFDYKKTGDVLVVKFNLNRATGKDSEVFKNELNKFIDEGWVQIVLEMKNCHFVDSTFLSAILICYKKVKLVGGNLAVSSLNNEVASVIELTGVKKFFSIYPSLKDAIAAFKKSA